LSLWREGDTLSSVFMARSIANESPADRKLVEVPSTLSNADFLEGYARPGCVGLACGTSLIDRAIARAERHVDEGKCWGQWTHAFMFSERRADKHLWVVESDLQIYHKHIQLGVQENRSSKYYDEGAYTSLAVLDFGLDEEWTRQLVTEALDMVANRARYSLRELVGTWLALKRPGLRQKSNLLARDHCFFCSAFVQFLFRQIGVDLAPGVNIKNTTPEDIARSPHPHLAYVLQREVPTSELQRVAGRIRRRIGARIRAARHHPAKASAPLPAPG
jgi:hypothetical protein